MTACVILMSLVKKCTGLLCESFYRCHLKTFRVGNQLITTYIINCGASEQ